MAENKNPSSGAFVISLDLELHWGVCDREDSLTEYRDNLLEVRNIVPRLLELFSEFDIRASWATVGMLFFQTREELIAHLPDTRPGYADSRLSAYKYLDLVGDNETDDPLHFAPSLIEKIGATEGQEVASHTFSHFYCLEKGQSVDSFEADIEAAVRAAERRNIELKSLVFPRNQCNLEYLSILEDYGFRAYRGNPPAWMYEGVRHRDENLIRRGFRLIDSYIPLTSPEGSENLGANSGSRHEPVNISGNRFLRPYFPTLEGLEEIRFRRIRREMRHAAEQGTIYHLWWHPHNFGENPGENFEFLRRILEYHRQLDATYGMPSLTMDEAARPQPVAA